MKQFESIDDVYVYYADKIRNAQTAAPRGLLIKELIGEGFEIKDPRKRILGNTGRKMSLSFAVGEFLWYLRGSNSVKIMQYYSKIYPNFSDDGITAHGAYGPRIFGDKQNSMNSWQAIIELLSRDPDSRQAIIPIYRAEDVGSMQGIFRVLVYCNFCWRSNKLNCITYMRSNDLYLGLPYDVFSFTMFQELMSLALGVDLGFYKHIVGSLHVYEKHFDSLEKIISAKPKTPIQMPPMTQLNTNQKARILEEEERIRKKQEFDSTGIDLYWQNLLYFLEKKAGMVLNTPNPFITD